MLGRQFGCSEMDEACPKSENDVRLLSKLIHLNPICLHVGVVSQDRLYQSDFDRMILEIQAVQSEKDKENE